MVRRCSGGLTDSHGNYVDVIVADLCYPLSPGDLSSVRGSNKQEATLGDEMNVPAADTRFISDALVAVPF